jgi:predicted metal-dependent peptidase
MDRSIVSEALSRLSLGRAYVNSRADYYDGILLDMVVEVVDVPGTTMGITQGLVLYVNGPWLLSDPEVQAEDVIGSCLVHESEHILRGFERVIALPDENLAGIAADEAINFNLQEEKWPLPSWVIYPSTYNHPPNLTLEQYYSLLEEELRRKNKTLQQLMDGKQPKQAATSWQPKIGAGGCGSGGGHAVNKELEAALDAAYGKNEAEVLCAKQQTLDAIEAALDGPGRFKTMIKARYNAPEVDWRKLCRRLIQRSAEHIAGNSVYSMRNPSVGGQLAGVLCAGLVDHRPNVVLVEDTSGSMGHKQLLSARSEVYHLMRSVGIEEAVHLQVDVYVQSDRRIRLRDLPKIDYKGRGGTDFTKVFDYVRRKYRDANLLVYYTDGDGTAPAKSPRGLDVIWCIVRSPYARRPAPWGHLVVCDKSQKL